MLQDYRALIKSMHGKLRTVRQPPWLHAGMKVPDVSIACVIRKEE